VTEERARSLSTLPEAFRPDRLEMFWRFVCERQKIWVRRNVERRLQPWTQDDALRDFRFTNVYRELDPGTSYAVEKILDTNAPIQDRIFNIMLYRLLGREETYEFIGFQSLSDFDAAGLQSKLKFIRDELGKPPFSGAYTVCAYYSMGSRDKVENVCRILSNLQMNFTDIYRQLRRCTSSKSAYLVLRSAQGFGTFLAYQVLVDLLYPLKLNGGRPILPFSLDDWAIAGPGAKRGVSALLRTGTKIDELRTMKWLRDNQEAEFVRLLLDFPYLQDSSGQPIRICLANIQNCLCEFYKYVKIKTGTGRARRRFVPRASPLGEQLELASTLEASA
jgi:hypothetical protein